MILVEHPSTDPYFNLALEEHIFNALDAERSYLYLWQNDNAIVVGKNQNTVEEVNARYVAEHGIRVVRRLSGGGAVYHDLGNLNFSIITSAKRSDTLDIASFCLPVAEALRDIGIPAEVNGRNDITIHGRKFSGNSQYLQKNRVMHHGTIMFDSNLDTLANALRAPREKIESKSLKSVRSRVTNVKEHAPEGTTLADFTRVLKQKLLGSSYDTLDLTDSDIGRVQELREGKYLSWDWNYGYSPAYAMCRKKRCEGCGTIEVRMNVAKGRIADMRFFGDYFGVKDTNLLSSMFIGVRAEKGEYERILGEIDVGDYFGNLSAGAFLELLADA